MSLRAALSGAIGVVLCLWTGCAQSALTWTAQWREDGRTRVITTYLEGPRMRVESAGGPDAPDVLILDGEHRTVILLNHARRTYTEITEDDLRQLKTRIEEARARESAQLPQHTPEQRELAELLTAPSVDLTAQRTRNLTFAPLGQNETINGYACEVYRTIEAGLSVEEACLAPWSAQLVAQADLEGVLALIHTFAGFGIAPDHVNRELARYPGFPIHRVWLGSDQKPRGEETIQRVKRARIPAALFTAPAGYAREHPPVPGEPRRLHGR